MNPRTKRKMDKINQRLADNQQIIRITDIRSDNIILSNGLTLAKSDADKFVKRVMNKKIIEWVKNIDNIIAGIVDESQIKSISFSIGGKACQQKHGEKLRKNLNSGIPWNKGKTGVQVSWNKGLTKDKDHRVMKLAKFGEKNGMFGIKMSDQEKSSRSTRMKDAILSGKFTPKSNNRNTHWEASYLGKKFRSSWEAWFQSLFPLAEYETLRVCYKSNNEEKIYIVDFIDHANRIVAEVKPEELTKTETFLCKWKYLVLWARERGYTPVIVTKRWLVDHTHYIDYSSFDTNTSEKIKRIYEASKKN